MAEINAEFGLGTNLYAYRGVKWYRDDNTRGYFDQAMGNNPPIDMLEFYGKRKTIPVTPTGNVGYGNGSYFSVPFYNKLTITMQGGSGGTRGSDGYNGCNYTVTGGGAGGTGSPSSFGSYGSAGGGGSDSAGQVVVIVIDAETNSNAPLRGVPILVTVGGGGGGGAGGANAVLINGRCYGAGNAASGSTGASGSVTIKVE
jgi:hypothetical protein